MRRWHETEFVVSRVAMSVCALMVVWVLSGFVGQPAMTDAETDLADVVNRVCWLADWAAMSQSQTSVAYQVPCLADGSEVAVVIHRGIVAAEAAGERALGQPTAWIHTWLNTGAAMNVSGLRLLDERAERFTAFTGESILLSTQVVCLGNQPTYLLFVSGAS